MSETSVNARLDLALAEDAPLDALVKGFPSHRPRARVRDAAALGLNILREDLLFPVAVLKQSALEENRRFMRAFLAHTGAKLAPHGKTTMAPQLFQAQLEDGAWAITVATVAQLQVCRRFGVPRVVLANQLVGTQELRVVMDELAHDDAFELFTLADSLAGVRLIADAARARAVATRAPARRGRLRGRTHRLPHPRGGARGGARNRRGSCARARRCGGLRGAHPQRRHRARRGAGPGLPR